MILQQVMLAVVVFLGMQLMCNKPGATGPHRTAAEILGDLQNPKAGEPPTPKPGENWDFNKATMAWANATLRTQTMTQLNQAFQTEIDQEEKDKKLSKEEAQRMRMQGVILLANTEFRKGVDVNDTGMIRTAFTGLAGWQRKHQAEAIWKDFTYPVAQTLINPGRFPRDFGQS